STSWASPVTLTASDALPGDAFGTSVAVYGRWIVVGAPSADGSGGSAQGAAYIFEYASGVWTQRAKLTSSTAAANDTFGSKVAVFDGRIAVGCPGQDISGRVSQGAVHVFRYSGGIWVF